MSDPTRSLWTTPDPHGRSLASDDEEETPAPGQVATDTESIAERAGFDLGPPALPEHEREDDRLAAAPDAEVTYVDERFSPFSHERDHPTESVEAGASGGGSSGSTWDAEPSVVADAGDEDAAEWDRDESGWDPDASAPVDLGDAQARARAATWIPEGESPDLTGDSSVFGEAPSWKDDAGSGSADVFAGPATEIETATDAEPIDPVAETAEGERWWLEPDREAAPADVTPRLSADALEDDAEAEAWPPTGSREFSELGASPEAVPSRRAVPLTGDARVSHGEPTTVDLEALDEEQAEPLVPEDLSYDAITPEAELRARYREQVAATSDVTDAASRASARWLLTGETAGTATAEDELARARVVNVLLTVFAVVVVVVVVLGFLVLVDSVL